MFSTNDSKPYCWNKKKFIKPYTKLIDEFKNQTVCICLPPPCFYNESKNQKHIIDDRIISGELKKILISLSQKYRLKTVDLYTALYPFEQYMPDGVHPNTDGDTIIAAEI